MKPWVKLATSVGLCLGLGVGAAVYVISRHDWRQKRSDWDQLCDLAWKHTSDTSPDRFLAFAREARETIKSADVIQAFSYLQREEPTERYTSLMRAARVAGNAGWQCEPLRRLLQSSEGP